MIDLLIRLVIWIIKEATENSETTLPQAVDTPEMSLQRSVWGIARRLPALEEEARRQLAALENETADLKDQLAPALEEGALALAAALEQQKQELVERIDLAGAATYLGAVQHYAGEVQRLDVMLKVTRELTRQRRSEIDRAVLGDADALAAACYGPILDFAGHQNLKIASNRPMTFFYPAGTFIELAFLEQKLAPIGLPEHYRTQPWWWPAIAHEIAHDLYASLPDLGRELADELELATQEQGPLTPGTERFNRFLFQIWLEEIFADAVGALMIGPAYLRAMTAIFRQPEAPDKVVEIPISGEGVIDPHPPRHLRVHITARFLSRAGFSSEARRLTRSWDQEHREPEHAALIASGHRQELALAPLLEQGARVADQLYDAEPEALASHRLADVPGLNFSALHVQRAEKAKPLLAAGQPVAFDARALIAAATEGALDAPERVAQINQATRLSIVGVGTGERVAKVRALATAFSGRTRAEASRAERTWRFAEALLLEELLEDPASRRQAIAGRARGGPNLALLNRPGMRSRGVVTRPARREVPRSD